MADNTVLSTGSGGDTIATDDIAGVKYPRSKLVIGADGTNDGDVSATNPMPVKGTGTAGTANAGVVTIQGIASMTPIQIGDNSSTISVDDGAGSLTVDGSVSITGTVAVTQSGTWDEIGINDSGNSITVDWAGTAPPIGAGLEATALRVTLATDSTGVVSIDDNGGSLTVDGTVAVSGTVAVTQSGTWDEVGINDSGNSITVDAPVGTPAFVRLSDGASAITTLPVSLASVPSHAVTNAGTFATQVDGSALTALQLIDDTIFADDAAFTIGTSKVSVAGGVVDDASTDSADEGDAAAVRLTATRQMVVNPQPHTVGGLSIARDIDLDNSTLTVVKASAGQLYGWHITNTSTATVFVKFYDATSGTLGTGTPVLTIGIPGNATDDTLALANFGGMGVAFATGICVGAGTGVADADTADPGANAVVANFFYK